MYRGTNPISPLIHVWICVLCLTAPSTGLSATTTTDGEPVLKLGEEVSRLIQFPMNAAMYELPSRRNYAPTVEADIGIAMELQRPTSERESAAERVLAAGTIAQDAELQALGHLLVAMSMQAAGKVGEYELAKTKYYDLQVAVQDSRCLAIYYRMVGLERMSEQQYEEAAKYLASAVVRARTAELDDLVMDIQLQTGVCLRRLGALQTAVTCYEDVHRLATEQGNMLAVYSARNNMAFIFLELGELEKAEELYKSIRRDFSPMIDFAVGLGLADVTLRKGDPEAALAILDETRKRLNGADGVPRFQYGIGRLIEAKILMALGKLEEAQKASVIASASLNRWQPQRGLEAKLITAEIMERQEKLEHALAMANSVATDVVDPFVRHKALMLISRLREKRGEYQQALAAYRDASTALSRHTAIAGQVEAMRAAEIIGYEERIRTMNEQIKLANAQNQLAHAESARARAEAESNVLIQRITLAVAAICICCVFVYGGMSRRLFRERQLKEQEAKLNLQLSELVEEKSLALQQEMIERAELESALERKRRDAALGRLTGTVAHDFNNLLQVVLTTNQLLHRETLSERQIEMVAASTKSAQAGAAIIRQLLAYTRQQTLVTTTVGVSEYFKGVSGLLNASMGSGIQLILEDKSDNGAIEVDAAQLTTTLINLLTNAVDAIPRDRLVRLTARQIELTADEAQQWSELPTGKYVAIDVVDHGLGMSEEVRNRAFEPFFSNKPHGRGTGLGLSSSLGFIRQSGGDIRIFQLTEGGTRVSVLLPLSCNQPEVISSVPRPHLSSRGRILVVEDDRNVAVSLREQLRHFGYSVEMAQSGYAAIHVLSRDSQFDIVLTDIRMSGSIDGIALRDWVHSNCKSTSVVLMSGYTDAETLETGTMFLPKPFSEDQLLATLTAAVA